MNDPRLLVADDDSTSAQALIGTLSRWGYEVVSCKDGVQAWEALQQPNAPPVAILDWMMPGMNGVEICERVRTHRDIKGMYIILLTMRSSKEDVVEGLSAGADDYLIKPYDIEEMRARVAVGVRVVALQNALAAHVAELERAARHITQLHGLLPMCAYCKSIRNDQNYWERVEHYISEHSEVVFTHGICPACYEKLMVGKYDRS